MDITPLKQCRLDRRWTLAQAAQQIGISESALSNLEHNKRHGSHDVQQRASEVYQKSVDELFFTQNFAK